MKTPRCCVSECGKTRKDAIRLHKFPRNVVARQKWLHMLNSPRLSELSEISLSNLFVCSRHFEQRFFALRKLKYSAYPSLFTEEEIETGVPRTPTDDIQLNIQIHSSDHTYAAQKAEPSSSEGLLAESRKRRGIFMEHNYASDEPDLQTKSARIIVEYPSTSSVLEQAKAVSYSGCIAENKPVTKDLEIRASDVSLNVPECPNSRAKISEPTPARGLITGCINENMQECKNENKIDNDSSMATPAKEATSDLPGDEDSGTTCRTYVFQDESHTLGNALKCIMNRYEDVQFCGYTVPHPAEAKMHFRIQSIETPALEVLKRGLRDLEKVCDHTMTLFESEVNEFVKNKP